MIPQKIAVAAALTPALLAAAAVAPSEPSRLDKALESVTAPAKKEKLSEKIQLLKPKQKEKVVILNASPAESEVLDALQARGILAKPALAAIMGNIKQESKFIPNICEGGARVSHGACRRGGYGLIQWTSTDRYHGLGRHSSRLGLDSSTLRAQISYMFKERQWLSAERGFKRPGNSVEGYMRVAYPWIGWGIHGNRTRYAYDYLNRMRREMVPHHEHPTIKFSNGHPYVQ